MSALGHKRTLAFTQAIRLRVAKTFRIVADGNDARFMDKSGPRGGRNARDYRAAEFRELRGILDDHFGWFAGYASDGGVDVTCRSRVAQNASARASSRRYRR